MGHLFASTVRLLIATIVVVSSFSFLVWVLPGFFYQPHLVEISDARVLSPLELEGRDVYVAQGCHVCHTQMVRDIETDRLRFGAATRIEDDIYEHPNLWGSMRNGPDLANVGLRYSADWQRQHLRDPRSLVPESIMPTYPWLIEQRLNTDDIEAKMKGLRTLGVPYTDEDIAGAQAQLEGKTKADALVAYLVQLGTDTVEEGPK